MTSSTPRPHLNGHRPHLNGTGPRFGAVPFAEKLDSAIDRAVGRLFDLQYDDGYWWGELEANCAIHAEYLLLTHFMDVPDPKRWRKVVNYLKSMQLDDGGWPIWYGGPSDLSIAVECYFAMKLAGEPPDDPAMTKAREFILAQGGVPNTRVFTKMWLALFGQWEWAATPVLPVEIMHLPSWFPLNIYEFASWARGTIVACTILLTEKPVCPVPESARIDELYPNGRENTEYTFGKKGKRLGFESFFRAVDHVLRLLDRRPFRKVRQPFRVSALKKAEEWIIDRQEADGSWGGIQPPWVYSLMALRTMGYSNDHPVIKKGLKGFDGFARETEDTFRTEPCISPVWDTCLAMIALQDADVLPGDPRLTKAAEWLLDAQILEHAGDWRVKRPELKPGGWAFEFANDAYPDIDDTAMVMIALHKMRQQDDPRMNLALERSREWLEGMQSKNGGWGAFDVDNFKRWVSTIPFCDFGEVVDPPSEDVTAHVLEILGRMGYNTSRTSVTKGLDYLKETQENDGSWWGRWGVNYIYGLGAVLPALQHIGEDMGQPYIRRALDWIMEHQHEDGGWGEGVESYIDPSLRGKGPSTKSQTAWALLGLIAGGRAETESAKRGVDYLLRNQQEDGSWDEPEFTGTGFPRDFMINYHLYRYYWPLMALGQYRQAVRAAQRGVRSYA